MLARVLSRAMLAVAGAAAIVASPAVAAPRQLVVPPSNPYWTLLSAQSHKALSYGARVGTCTFVPRTSCVAAQLSRRQLSGAFVPFGHFQAADLAGSSLAASFITHANFRAANLTGVSLVGTTPVPEDALGRADAESAVAGVLADCGIERGWELAPALAHYLAPSGTLIASGILADKAILVENALQTVGLRVIETLQEEDWLVMAANRE